MDDTEIQELSIKEVEETYGVNLHEFMLQQASVPWKLV